VAASRMRRRRPGSGAPPLARHVRSHLEAWDHQGAENGGAICIPVLYREHAEVVGAVAEDGAKTGRRRNRCEPTILVDESGEHIRPEGVCRLGIGDKLRAAGKTEIVHKVVLVPITGRRREQSKVGRRRAERAIRGVDVKRVCIPDRAARCPLASRSLRANPPLAYASSTTVGTTVGRDSASDTYTFAT